jgi:hypothetical protein
MFGGETTPTNNLTASPSATNSDTPTQSGTTIQTRSTPEVDVNGVQYESADGIYTFHVTLDHEGEEGGVNWWEIETLDGEKLLRTKLSSVHMNERVTSSGEVEIPDDVSAVVIRGHGAVGRYGGRVILVDLDSGNMAIEDQGHEIKHFSDYSF